MSVLDRIIPWHVGHCKGKILRKNGWNCEKCLRVKVKTKRKRERIYRNDLQKREVNEVIPTEIHVRVHDWNLMQWTSSLWQVKPGSQYEAGASTASWASWWCWNRLEIYSSVASPVSNQSDCQKYAGIEFEWWKKNTFPVVLVTLTAPASYCEPGFSNTSQNDTRTLADWAGMSWCPQLYSLTV